MIRLPAVAALTCAACSTPAPGIRPVPPPLVLEEDGGWCWFQDERALVLDQISWAERIRKGRVLARMAKRYGKADAVIFLAIARDPKRLRGYLRILRNLKK